MPIAPPFPSSPVHNALFPALYLYPLNDTWTPKHIALTSQHTKIGRQTSSKTAPGERNGFFDSKVLSRQHAEVWEEGGKIFIKDVKSSNGTFINGERLSSEAHESDPFELKSDDIVEFGIDIVGEDNKTIIHHKVAARVVCVFSEQDAAVAARAEQHQAAAHQQQQQQLHQHQQLHLQGTSNPQPHHAPYLHPGQSPNGLGIGAAPGGASSSSLAGGQPGSGANFPFSGGGATGPRRTQLAHAGLGSMGGPPSLARAPGKSGTGLSFDVILSRLQGEVQKSRETGAELGGLQGIMGEVEGVLGGRGPANLPNFPSHLPSVRPPSEAQPPAPQPPPAGPVPAPPAGASTSTSSPPPSEAATAAAAATSSSTTAPAPTTNGVSHPTDAPPAPLNAALVAELQAQLAETQSSLAVHLERVRALEGVLQEQAAIRREVGVLRGLVEGRRPAGEAGQHEHEHDAREREQKAREERALEGLRYDPDELELLERPHDALDDLREEEEGEDDEEEDEDEDDRRSVSTVMPHELERVDEEDEEEMEEEERRAQREEAAGREHDDDGAADAHRESGVSGHAAADDDANEDRFRPPIPLHPAQPEEEEQSAFEHDDAEGGARREEVDEVDADEDDEETQQEIEEQERRRAEDLGVGRPLTPEPSLLGLGLVLGAERRERRTGGSPLSATPASSSTAMDIRGAPPPATTATMPTTSPTATATATKEDVHAQVERLAAQVGAVLALTTTLEKQHASAQGTIRELEEKVRSLEGLLATTSTSSPPPPTSTTADAHEHQGTPSSVDADVSTESETTPTDVEGSSTEDATDAAAIPANPTPSALTAWTRSIAGQWSTLQADWARERTSLARAKEDWDARALRLDAGLSKLDAGLAKADGVQSAVAGLLAAQERVREAVREQGGRLEAHIAASQGRLSGNSHHPGEEAERWGNGDAVKHSRRGGLVTPPSPRSQSSDSARYRRRRRRSSGSRRGSSGGARSDDESEGEDADEDHGKHSIGRALGLATATAVSGAGAGALATPESSIYKFSAASKGGDDSGLGTDTTTTTGMHTGVLTAPATRANSHAQSPLDAPSEAASLPLLGLSLWTLLLILSFSFAAVAFSLSVLHVLFVRCRAWVALRIQDAGEALVDSPVAEDGSDALKGKPRTHPQPALNVQAAFGVVVLSIAAAAVIWKIRPAD